MKREAYGSRRARTGGHLDHGNHVSEKTWVALQPVGERDGTAAFGLFGAGWGFGVPWKGEG